MNVIIDWIVGVVIVGIFIGGFGYQVYRVWADNKGTPGYRRQH